MSNATYSSPVFKPVTAPATTLLGELFAATPLSILLAALQQNTKR